MRFKSWLVILFAIGSFILTGCGATSSMIPFKYEPPTEKAEARIYIYRIPSFVGGAVPWEVLFDKKKVGILKQKAYMVIQATPGRHTLKIGSNVIPLRDPNRYISSGEIKNLEDIDGEPLEFKSSSVYFIRAYAVDATFLSENEALPELEGMKFDQGL